MSDTETEVDVLAGTASPLAPPVVPDDESATAPVTEQPAEVGQVVDPDPAAIPPRESRRISGDSADTPSRESRGLSGDFVSEIAKVLHDMVRTNRELNKLQINPSMLAKLEDTVAKETGRKICRLTEHEIQENTK